MEERVLVFKINNEDYCIPVTHVKEVQTYTKTTPIPQSQVFIHGLINLRGQIIPILDLTKMFNMQDITFDANTCFIVVEVNGELIGILADSVSEVINVPKNLFKPPPENLINSIGEDYIIGVANLKDQLLILIDIDKIVSSLEESEYMF